MEITIKDTVTVYPSTLAPPFDGDHVLPLSHLDNDRNLRVIIRYFRVYVGNQHHLHRTSTPSDDPFQVISDSLSRALVCYYPLAGTLRRRAEDDDRLELFWSVGRGVSVVRAVAECSLESVDYLDDPSVQFVENLVPDPSPEEGLINPFMLQVTVFKCGGYCLGEMVHHAMCDGVGATQFFNVMAELARGSSQTSVEPVWDRVKWLGHRKPPRVEVPLEEVLLLDKGSSPYQHSGGPIGKLCFQVKDEWLDRFKNQLLEESGCSFTTFEALGAFIWRAKVKASGVPTGEKVKFAYSINIRKLVNPPLPAGYWGNGCVPLYAQLTARDLVEQPLWKTAELIKKSKRQATDEYVHSFIDFQELNYGKGITAGRWVSGFTDWRHLGHSTMDFGWGGPVTVLPLSRNLLGSVEPCFFLPYSSIRGEKKDGFKVLITLPEIVMHGFKEEMGKLSSEI
ncbi:hypothetical protein Ancab_005385 [Ancistrocladus abbreviatus]